MLSDTDESLPAADRWMTRQIRIDTKRSELFKLWEDLERECRQRGIEMDVVLWRALEALAQRQPGGEGNESHGRA